MKKYSIAELLEMDLAGLPKTKMGLCVHHQCRQG